MRDKLGIDLLTSEGLRTELTYWANRKDVRHLGDMRLNRWLKTVYAEI